MKLLLKPNFSHDGEYGYEGRYPDSRWNYLEGSIPEGDDAIDQLPALLRSPEWEDRIRARVILHNLRATLPEMWVVRESEDSPNLNRDGHRTFRTLDAWSVHEFEEDAIAWRDMFQRKSDAIVARHGWGPSSVRKFEAVRAAGAPAGQLRQPGATPWTTAFD
jgi:hypothetical protein